VEDHDRRCYHRWPLTWRFSRLLPGLNTPQFHAGMSGTDLARRKPGVQIPSPPPPTSQVRASPASSGRRSPLAAAAPRPRAYVAVQPGRLAATRRLGPGPSTVTTERGRRLQPELRVRCDTRQSGPEATLAQANGRAVRGHGRTARPDPSWPCGCCPPHRRAPQSHRCRHRGRGRGTRGHRPRDTGRPHRTVDSGRVDITCADTGRSPGHRTPDAWTRPSTRTGRTSTRQAPDRHPGPPRPPDRPLSRRTMDLWTAPAALGNDDGSTTTRYLPARDYLPRYQAPAQSLRRPSRALAHCSPRMISGRA
jgi:hypothetical protein